MKDDCLFCNILKGKIPSDKVYEDDNVYAFKDINPLASIHLLFIHKKHTANINDLIGNDPAQLNDLFNAITKYAEDNDLLDGYRIVTNIGPGAGQTVFHTHFHVLSGEKLGRFGR